MTGLRSKNSGMSLVEVLVVLSIIGTVAIFAMPSMSVAKSNSEVVPRAVES